MLAVPEYGGLLHIRHRYCQVGFQQLLSRPDEFPVARAPLGHELRAEWRTGHLSKSFRKTQPR